LTCQNICAGGTDITEESPGRGRVRFNIGDYVGFAKSDIFKAVKAIGFTGMTLGLLGCVANDVAAPENVAQAEIEASAEKPAEFSSEGKPTKTIETPWGPREVFDPKYHPGVKEYYKYLRGIHGMNRTNAQNLKLQKLYEPVREAQKIQALDYARHQCMKQLYAGCSEVDFVFKSNCGGNKKLHSLVLSECENENYSALWPSVSRCSFNEPENFRLKVLTAPSLNEALDIALSRECKIWRGEAGDDFWEKDVVRTGIIPRTR